MFSENNLEPNLGKVHLLIPLYMPVMDDVDSNIPLIPRERIFLNKKNTCLSELLYFYLFQLDLVGFL